ncbi:MAG: glycerol-3-phosphate acyltransferase [Actinomycetota bacterium]
MSIGRSVVAAAVGYAAGTIPGAQLVAKGVDPTRAGSGNPGAANVASLLGPRAGAAVFGIDMSKALIAGRLGASLAGPVGANVASAATVLGHCFPATRGFRGGKGVAASFGQMLATFPAYLPVDLALGAVAAKSDFWKDRPVATIGATCGLWTGLGALSARQAWPNLWGPTPTPALPLAAAVSSAAIVWRFAEEARRAPDTPTKPGTSAE